MIPNAPEVGKLGLAVLKPPRWRMATASAVSASVLDTVLDTSAETPDALSPVKLVVSDPAGVTAPLRWCECPAR